MRCRNAWLLLPEQQTKIFFHWHGWFALILLFPKTKYLLNYTHAIWMWKKAKTKYKMCISFETPKLLVSICRLTWFSCHVRSIENICHLFIEHFWGKKSENISIKLEDLFQVAVLVFLHSDFWKMLFLNFQVLKNI